MTARQDRSSVGAQMVAASPTGAITDRMNRHNALIFALSHALIYLGAPVIYVGVVHAALCDQLGASATIANLPASAYFFGFFAPPLLSWMIPKRLEQTAIIVARLVTSGSLAVVFVTLFFPFPDTVRLVAVIGQGLILGFADSVAIVYLFHCLNRGTTVQGRARAFTQAFSFGPLFAVAGSLGAQYVLAGNVAALPYPRDFASLYLMGALCTAATAFLVSRMHLPTLEDEERRPLARFIREAVQSCVQVRTFGLLWLAYLLWFFTLNGMPNLSLYAREAVGRAPRELSGYIMALRFGFKALGGWVLGLLFSRQGVRAPLVLTVVLVGGSMVWAWGVPGYYYLLAFGLMGIAELAGAYFPNYMMSLSTPLTGARDLAMLQLVIPVSSVAPVLHGRLTDLLGFSASFAFGTTTAVLSLWLVLKLPAQPHWKADQAATHEGAAG